MAPEAGSVVEGVVIKLLPYGVLVRLEDGDTGLVHISEIDNSYVRDVSEYFQVDDKIEVKVLGVTDRGRLELSVRQVHTPADAPQPRRRIGAEERAAFEDKLSGFLRQSNERLLDLRRNIDSKRGGRRR